MTISGFTFVRNATKLYYPVKQSILSILDIVDEFVIALGDCAHDDYTRREIDSIGSPKIRILDTVWDLEKYRDGMEYAHQTDIAKDACHGDWLFYLQSDEVIHERFLKTITENCKRHLDNRNVEGFLLDYKHFWGDYKHYQKSHAWYPCEIRIIRNDPLIHSWNDAQSFRKIKNFDGINYKIKKGTQKLQVIKLDASVFHYGWVRPPELMQIKRKEFASIYVGMEASEIEYKHLASQFDYGPLEQLQYFHESHPRVMADWIQRFDWEDKLQQSGPVNPNRPKHKHEKFKYRVLTFIEQNFLHGNLIGGFKNYNLIRR
jgi:hypothetical protein